MTTAKAKIVSTENADGVLVITFDDPDSKVNALGQAFSDELRDAFDELYKDDTLKAAVLISGKDNGFIAGADVKMLQACRSAEEVANLSKEMQTVLNRVEQGRKPVVAAIHGPALGGGLEVALACHYRICTDSGKTVLALPEVMLGLLPGGGGTQRLPRLVGIQGALDMMLTGKNIRARKAKKMGLVDDVVIPFGLREVAIKVAKKLVEGSLKRKEREPSTQERALEDNFAGRAILFRQAKSMVEEKTNGLYPAPFAILDVVEKGMDKGMKRGLEEESKRFGELAMTNEAKSLMSLFFGQTALKKNRFGKPKVKADTIGVLGAGLMGAGIALVSAMKGQRVHLKDISHEGLSRGKKQIWDVIDRRRKRKAMTAFERDTMMSNVVGHIDYEGFDNCDVVIEAVFEDLKLKHRVIEELEANVNSDCIIASNTSALPITDIAAVSKRPENVIGMHYFSPVHKMPLLEIVTTDKTSDAAAAIAVDVGLRQGKTVIVVKDGPGFYTTRILAPFMDEAAAIAMEGMAFPDFDQVMMDFGFPVGPITLLDEVGIDVGAHVAHDMAEFFKGRLANKDTAALDAMIKAGFLGRKSKKGFYLYDSNKKDATAQFFSMIKKAVGKNDRSKPVNPAVVEILRAHGTPTKKHDITKIQNRMAMRMINEAVSCLQDGILANPVDGDIGAVFGLGFPPFHGGPFRYVDTVGAGRIVSTMEKLTQEYGPRFAPCQMLVDQAKAGAKFHKHS